MTIRTHAHTDHTTTNHAHVIRSGYVTRAGAERWAHAHPSTDPAYGYYVAPDTTGDDTYGVWCAPYGWSPLADRYGVAIATVDPATAFVSTVDGMGYASHGTGTYGAPTVPATADTPTFPADDTDTDDTDETCTVCNTYPCVCPDTDDAPPSTYADGTYRYTGTPVPAGSDLPLPIIDDTASMVAAHGPVTCTACGMPATPLDMIPVGAHVTMHVHGGDGTGRTITRTYTGTVAHDVIDADTDYDGWTIVRIDLDGGGSWTTPRTDYVAHVDTDTTTDDAPVTAPSAPVGDTDTDTYVTVFGRPVRAHVAASMGVVDPAPWHGMIPGRTYTGTSRRGTDYTVTTDGTITTRTYADGTTTRADVNHMWTTDADGRTTTYVVAEGTYWQEVAEGTYDRVSSASWPMVATCGHDFGAYGACIAPVGHPHAAHIDANGNKFTGTQHTYDARTYGPTHPTTYTRVVTRVPFHADTYRTVLRPDVADMARDYATLHAAIGGATMTLGTAYAAIVADMPHGTYDPHPHHYAAWAATLDAHYGTDY